MSCAKCDKPVIARGLCHRHYKQWQTHGGDAQRIRWDVVADPIAYVGAHLVRNEETGCWLYMGRLNSKGYGTLRIKKRTLLVHKFLWEAENGPIPPRLELDHFYCFNQMCCNPLHVEPVTHA